ncbi:hypothetical protein [Endozoicomonas sp. 8E]|uniref:hypothetical protein n=1 Tax=Endozoicomonas sp. 8E TaxID=3035692 RepID=UPI0029392F93|nr:hypothetical protein [Endozoicomonas sp. 8E]WOG29744.1 hypothetical protein P6910_08835 [Endozoicomonas sp. 8E]
MMASTLGFGGKSEIFPPHYPMFVEIEPNNSLEESEQDFYRQRMIEYSQNLTDYREPKPITDTVVTNLTAER